MSLNLQKELLEFQKELKELNSYSSEMKRMEKGLAEAEALASAATKAAERISSKHREHLQETKKELRDYLSETATSNKELISSFVKQFIQQIKAETERIGPLVDSLKEGSKSHLEDYNAILVGLKSIVSNLGPELTKYLEEIQANSKQLAEELSESLLSVHANHTEQVTRSLQEKTGLLIAAGEALQAQSKSQGKELAKVLSELYRASEFLASVSESISKTDFSTQLQGVEKEVALANSNIRELEDTLNLKSSEINGGISSSKKEILTLLEEGFDGTAEGKEEVKQLLLKKFDSLTNDVKLLNQKIAASDEAAVKNFSATNAAISKIGKELQLQLEKFDRQNSSHNEKVFKQLETLKYLVIGAISLTGILGLAWIARAIM